MKSAVLLLAHGAPERLRTWSGTFVRARRTAGIARSHQEVRRRYEAIGAARRCSAGPAPKPKRFRTAGPPGVLRHAQLEPFIRETMDQVRAAGIERLRRVPGPQYSELSVGCTSGHRGGAREAE